MAFKVINNVQPLARSSLCHWPHKGEEENPDWECCGLWPSVHPNDPFVIPSRALLFTSSALDKTPALSGLATGCLPIRESVHSVPSHGRVGKGEEGLSALQQLSVHRRGKKPTEKGQCPVPENGRADCKGSRNQGWVRLMCFSVGRKGFPEEMGCNWALRMKKSVDGCSPKC